MVPDPIPATGGEMKIQASGVVADHEHPLVEVENEKLPVPDCEPTLT
jgi:hypothetical protein